MVSALPGVKHGIVQAASDSDPIVPLMSSIGITMLSYLSPDGTPHEALNLPPPKSLYNPDLYVLHTSGSTGEPKAVIGSHQSTVARLEWWNDKYPSTMRTVVGHRAKLTFIDGLHSLLSALLYPPAALASILEVGDVLTAGATRVTMLPSQLEQLLMLPPPADAVLEHVVISGEPCDPSLPALFHSLYPDATLHNLYGSTETTGDSLHAILTPPPPSGDTVPIGRPLPFCTATLSPSNELIITGNLASRYHNSSPFASHKTGDIAKIIADQFHITGRLSSSIKINGILTGPAEVSGAFSGTYGIRCHAVPYEGRFYALTEGEVGFSRGHMRRAGVPWRLIPFAAIAAPEIKRKGGAGKVDASYLRSIVEESLNPRPGINSDPLTCSVSKILGVAAIKDTDSFADLGGDSASAVTLIYSLGREDLTTGDVLQGTIGELRQVLSGSRKRRRVDPLPPPSSAPFEPSPPLVVSPVHAKVRLSACVDASPVPDGGCLLVADQTGLVAKVSPSMTVLAFSQTATSHHDPSALITPDMTIISRPNERSEWGWHPTIPPVLAYGDSGTFCDITGGLHFESGGVIRSFKVSNRPIHSAPVKCGPESVVFGGHDGLLRCYDLEGAMNWEVSVGSVIYASPLVHEGMVVVVTTSGVCALVTPAGVQWKINVEAEIWSTPVFWEGKVVFGGRDGFLHFVTVPFDDHGLSTS